MKDRNPYKLDEAIEACAAHAWHRRSTEFQAHGIENLAALCTHIKNLVDGPQTRVFCCQPLAGYGQTLCREVYNAPVLGMRAAHSYEMTVILNPNCDAGGKIYGGTCVIRRKEKGVFERRVNEETRNIGCALQIVCGGRPALREREDHQQIACVGEWSRIPSPPVGNRTVTETSQNLSDESVRPSGSVGRFARGQLGDRPKQRGPHAGKGRG